MDALDINYRLRRLGTSQARIARELGVSQSVVGNVINDRITSYDIASHIARLLGMRVEELWPDRYRFKPRGPAPNRRVPNRTGGASPLSDSEESNMT